MCQCNASWPHCDHIYIASTVVVISEVKCIQIDGTLLWAWKFCRYSRIVVISEVVISEVDCTLFIVEIKTGKMPNNIGPTVNKMLKDIVEK